MHAISCASPFLLLPVDPIKSHLRRSDYTPYSVASTRVHLRRYAMNQVLEYYEGGSDSMTNRGMNPAGSCIWLV